MPSVRSVAIGFWADVGSRDELDEIAGATHFLEHLLFKGTDTRSAREIAEGIEGRGGDMNAFTARECTSYFVRVVDDELELALDVLSDIVWAPALRADELEAERQVILEEIRMRDDTPDDLVHDVFARALFSGPLGRDVIGDPETVASMTRDDVAAYHHDRYVAENIVVAVSGNVEHPVVVDGVDRRFAGRSETAPPSRVLSEGPAETVSVLRRSTEQAHVIVGVPALARDDDDRYALTVLNQALGGGMSSRLFQEIREKRGLAYSVYSYRQSYQETGLFGAYAGTAPHQAHDVVKLIDGEFDRIVADRGLGDDELDRAKNAIKGGLALSLESPAARMNRIGRSEISLGEVLTIDELIEKVDAVTPDDITRVVDRVLVDTPRTITAVGPFEEGEIPGV